MPAPPAPAYGTADMIIAAITDASIPADGRAIVEFQLTDGNGTAITDLQVGNVRFVLAKLQGSPLGTFTGNWQSYKNLVASPEVGTGTEDRLQATYERNEDEGEFTNNMDGTYTYRYATDVNNPEHVAQATLEGLDLSYEPDRTHRVAIQFDGAANATNPWYDWIPATGATEKIFHRNIAETMNCNRCHDPLAIHGGGRIQVEYCVTCHNPGTTDPDSTNTVDMKVMIHKIHRGANLPSVQDGGEYVIYGFRNRPHDYSNIHFPQDIRNCQNCHVNTGTERADLGWYTDILKTSQGDNWNEYPTRAACGSCHDDVDFDTHLGGQPDDSKCGSCHSPTSARGALNAHKMLVREAGEDFAAEVVSVSNTGQGEFPTVNFRIFNPKDGTNYNLDTDPAWTQGGGTSRLFVTLGWDTDDYTNAGNGPDADNASTVGMDALADAVPSSSGNGSYDITSTVAIPDGSISPNIPATGSGVTVVEGHPAVDPESTGTYDDTPLTNVHQFYSIDEADGLPDARREVVAIDQCLNCHETLVLHGGNRSDNIDSCVSCHNPRNTDFRVRPGDATDGKREESLDFKTMVHAIHAAGIRENPLQIVGFRGFNTHVYDEDAVHYPGDLSNCDGCHIKDEGTWELPIASTVLGTTNDTGPDVQDPADDTVTTPNTAICSSCHDSAEAAGHMETNGGSFNTTQADIDNRIVVEQCDLCHAEGRSEAVSELHNVR
jgi:OmcA/MtrC family decaheme c-type cytochrome